MSNILDLLNCLDSNVEEVREQYERAPFGWVGGKSRSLKYLLPHIPYRRCYVEPFGGSGVVMLNRNPSPLEVFNDRHSGVVAFYRCIRDPEKLGQLIDRLELTIHSREEFIWCKQTFKDVVDDVERAARWYYMIETSFSNKGQYWGRVRYGKNTSNKISNKLKEFDRIHDRFRNVQVENQNWRQIILDYDSHDTVFYCDPPYLGTDTSLYDGLVFKRDDHIQLLETLQDLNGIVVLSGYPNLLYDDYKWDERYEWEVAVTTDGQVKTNTNKKQTAGKVIKTTEVAWILNS
jgi:DNA adenine methylase